MATFATLNRRIKKLEKASEQRKKVMSRFVKACLCFPEGHRPQMLREMKINIAFSVKCPIHGDRFRWKDALPRIFQPDWIEHEQWKQALTRNPLCGWDLPRRIPEQYGKAFLASFPADLWSVDETEQWEGGVHKTYLRLQDGTRIQVEQHRRFELTYDRGGDDPTFRLWKTEVLCHDPGDWEMETMQTMTRLLSARGYIVDPVVFCSGKRISNGDIGSDKNQAT